VFRFPIDIINKIAENENDDMEKMAGDQEQWKGDLE
jgi:hypothetical protein